MKIATEGQYNPQVFIVEAGWNPGTHDFDVLNTETPRGEQILSEIGDTFFSLFRNTCIHDGCCRCDF